MITIHLSTRDAKLLARMIREWVGFGEDEGDDGYANAMLRRVEGRLARAVPGDEAYRSAHVRGLHEGVVLAKAGARVLIPYQEPWGDRGPKVYEFPRVDWTDVDAEISRRAK